MKRVRLFVNDLSKLKSLGFEYFPNITYSGKGGWRCNRIRVDDDGFVLVSATNVETVMKLVELGKLGLLEKRLQVRKPKVQITVTEEEYEEFKKWKTNNRKR